MTTLVKPVDESEPTFAAIERCDDVSQLDAQIAIIGVPHGVPYPYANPNAPTPASGPSAIREHSARYGRFFANFDFDLGGPVLNGTSIRMVDCGDVNTTPDGGSANHELTADAIRAIRSAGAVPIVLGGDDSIPIGVMQGLDADSDISLVQFDAHLDFRDESYGIRDGWSSSIRRASEMAHFGKITQIGLRGAGSATIEDVEAARTHGNTFITQREIENDGIQATADRLQHMDAAYVAFDADVLDPSIAPGAASTAFGGMTYWQASELLQAVARRGTVVGANFAEVNAALDPSGRTANLIARLILNFVGAMVRSPQFAGFA